MQIYSQKYITFALGTLAVLGIPVYSYAQFMTYKPDINKERQEVKGSQDMTDCSLPFPTDYTLLSNSQTTIGRQLVFHTSKTALELQTFYQTALIEQGWQKERETQLEEFYSTEYKNGNERVKITSARQEKSGKTLAIIDIYWAD